MYICLILLLPLYGKNYAAPNFFFSKSEESWARKDWKSLSNAIDCAKNYVIFLNLLQLFDNIITVYIIIPLLLSFIFTIFFSND